ncbi:unnamed protein product [Eruca vesicaria subsp. sativa]|uniref:Acetolactate synthase n=1 Tax=Eruca vesicaria subsp. sativa TaxID=29727 RepID=A0ABC8KQ71_ERUVS|nr:unnamed protein product [Eruca vesicaria subsp. sativa]
MATITTISTSFYKYHDHSSSRSLLPISKLHLPLNPPKPSYIRCRNKHGTLFCSATLNSAADNNIHRHDPKKQRKGTDILLEALERQGIETVFTYRGCVSTEIHLALKRSSSIRHILSRNEKSALFAAEGYARSSGKTGVCIITASDKVANCLADTCVPLVAIITSKSPSVRKDEIMTIKDPWVRKDETPMDLMMKHRYVVMDANDIPKIIKEAFVLATSGRPGLVLIDFPEDIQTYYAVPIWESYWEQTIRLIKESKKPMLYVGDGCLNSIDELNRFVQLTGIPVTSAMMGLGSYPSNDEFSLQTFGMQRTVYANHALKTCDLLLAFGVGSDEPLPSDAKIVHIDIDALPDTGRPLIPVPVDVKSALQEMNKILEKQADELKLDFNLWRVELEQFKQQTPLAFKAPEVAIPPQYVIQVLNELTDGNAFISTGVGQQQMWAAQYYNCKKPMHWLASRGFEAMGFGLSAAIGASVANPSEVVVYIDGGRSFLKNVPDLTTIGIENLPVKMLILNDKNLGVKATLIPSMLKLAEVCKIPGRSVSRREEVREAIQTMLDTPGPYMLDLIVPRERESA